MSLQDAVADAIMRAIIARPHGCPRPLLEAARKVHRKRAGSGNYRTAFARFTRMLPRYSGKLTKITEGTE